MLAPFVRRAFSLEASVGKALHIPVLVDRVVSFLGTSSGRVLDATCGTGGHSEALLASSPSLRVQCMDRDEAALSVARARLERYGARASFTLGSFSSAVEAAPGPYTGVLVDFGLGSHQLDGPRGFSYRTDSALDMRFGVGEGGHDEGDGEESGEEGEEGGVARPLTAARIVTSWPSWRLRAILEAYGECAPPMAATLASAITAWRGAGTTTRSIKSTLELRFAIEAARRVMDEPGGAWAERVTRRGFSKAALWVDTKEREKALYRTARAKPKYPAEVRAVFQALRLAVNDELGHVGRLLASLPALLEPGGRAVALTFTPAESALVESATGALTRMRGSPWSAPAQPETPSPEEVKGNRRARSAHLHVLALAEGAERAPSTIAAERRAVREALAACAPRPATSVEQLSMQRPLHVFTSRPAPKEAKGPFRPPPKAEAHALLPAGGVRAPRIRPA
jgi:16S rRNA C1402 N4-methylase RsmH